MGTTLRTLRYLRAWLLDSGPAELREVTLDRDGVALPATWALPAGSAPVGVWIVLHGLTRTGREHPSLGRFVGALTASGSAVLVPEVPEWRALRLAPEATEPTVEAGLQWLEDQPRVRGTRRGLVGFSFGAPQAIAASGDPRLRDRLHGVVAFGGYCDLERTVHFQLTGEHEWEGTRMHHRPDPYGRWIVAGNHLAQVPGREDHEDVAEALLELARRAGDAAVPSWGPALDPVREELRDRVAPERRGAFDFLAPPDRSDPSGPAARELAVALTDAARKANPRMEVRDRLGEAPGPIHLLHGRNDHLIPYTESWRIGAALSPHAAAQVTVTALFGHSAQDPFPWHRGARETLSFFRAMTRVLSLV